jgi:hypothetical protein
MTFRRLVYLPDRGTYLPEDKVPPGEAACSISGTELRERLADGRDLPVWFTPPEIAAELRRARPPDSAPVPDGTRGSARPGARAGPEPDTAAPGLLAGLRRLRPRGPRPLSLEPERHGD